MKTHTITKRFGPYPAAHRQHNHDGHCKLIHGHNWTFDVTFTAAVLDANKFVVDFGKFGAFKDELTNLFDHTFLVNSDDPCLPVFKALEDEGLAKIVVVNSGGAEGIAELVFQAAWQYVTREYGHQGRGVTVVSVAVHEDEKNMATYSRL